MPRPGTPRATATPPWRTSTSRTRQPSRRTRGRTRTSSRAAPRAVVTAAAVRARPASSRRTSATRRSTSRRTRPRSTRQQGNGNLNISPAIAIGGHESSCSSKCGGDRKQHGGASTFNSQGNGNAAQADVDQSNVVTQSQSASQTQSLGQSGGSCCKPRGGWKPPENGCKPAPHGDLRTDSASCGKEPKGGCRSPQDGQFNAHGSAPSCMPANHPGGDVQIRRSQSASFGDQTVERAEERRRL